MTSTAYGSRIDRYPQILSRIEELQRQLIDPAINNRDDQLLSELNMIMSEQTGKCLEFLEALVSNWDIFKAEGFALDNLLSLKKIYRIGESRSYTDYQQFIGQPGTFIPSGTVLISGTTKVEFVTKNSLTLSGATSTSGVYTVPLAENNTTYTVVVDGRVYNYTSDNSATKNEIYSGLSAVFSENPIPGTLLVVDAPGDSIIISASDGRIMNVQTSSNITAVTIVSRVRVEATRTGPVIAPIGTINTLKIPISGVISTQNTVAAIVGRLTETDEAFRVRGISSVASDGVATIPAITGSLINNVAGVTSAFIVENATAFTDSDGRPPHSYEVVVVGGNDQDVADDIWRTKPSAVQTYGNTLGAVRDSNGQLRYVLYTRPVPYILSVRVRYNLYDEEIFPISGPTVIRDAVVAHVNGLGVDKDIISGRIESAIYSSLGNQGLDEVIVDMQQLPFSGQPPIPAQWSSERIPIGSTQYASITNLDVYVQEI